MSEGKLIYLIGPRASGKTRVSQALAAKLQIPCVDLDDYFSEKFKTNIQKFVKENDWSAFRREESLILREVTAKYYPEMAIIATGGGIVLDENNSIFMRDHGQVFYLKVDVATLVSRLQKDPKSAQRPSLTNLTLQDEVSQILASREPLYLAAATQIVDGSKNLEFVLENIVKTLFFEDQIMLKS